MTEPQLMQAAVIGLMCFCSVILSKSNTILSDASDSLRKLTTAVIEFQNEVRDLRAEVRDLREFNDNREVVEYAPRPDPTPSR